VEEPSTIVAASFPTRPADPASSVAVADAGNEYAGFPTHGGSYAIMSTGKAVGVNPSLPGYTATYDFTDSGTAHPDPQGDREYAPADPAEVHDATAFRLVLDAPAGTECLSVSTRFFTDEIGSVGTANDQFLVMLESETLQQNIAFDPNNRRIEVFAGQDLAGQAVYTSSNASGTAYNVGTPTMTHQAPLTPGEFTITFWIFDLGDGTIDSTAFIDRLSFGHSDEACRAPLPVDVSHVGKPTVGRASTYNVAVTNPTTVPLEGSVQVQMPTGFRYVAGSTQGAVVGDPGIAGSTLTWEPVPLSAEESAVITFKMKPTTAGSRTVNASVTAADHSGSGSEQFAVARGLTTTTLEIAKKSGKVKASGTVKPKHPGRAVNVTLFRKEGGSFKKKKAAKGILNTNSRYAVSFARLRPGTCKITARFPGDSHHKPSSRSKTFAC
jgi:hypothetical protein